MDAIDTFEHAGLTVEIVPEEYVDEGVYSPREQDNIGTMFCWHPDYTLGDEQFSHDSHLDEREDEDGEIVWPWNDLANVAQWLRNERGAVVVLPLYLYDHSGISISCGNFAETIDPGGWDTSAVGFIYTTRERVAELCGEYPYKAPDFEGTPEEWLAEQLRAEVKEYDLYLTGDAGGFVIKNDAGDVLDSCWGYLGLWGDDAYVRTAAKAAAEDCRDSIEREKSEREFWAARDVMTVGC